MSPIDVFPASEDDSRIADRASQPAHYTSLLAVKRQAVAMVSRGASDRRSAFHTPVFVTNGLDGFPAARTVVLRGFDAGPRMLAVHTDIRSGKVKELAADNRAAAVFYDAKQKIQVRVTGLCTVHHGDDIAAEAWRRVAVFSRRCYLGAAPGLTSTDPTSGLPEALETGAPGLAESEAGFARFSVIRLYVGALDWLYLSARGHRRARLTWADGEESETATWLAP